MPKCATKGCNAKVLKKGRKCARCDPPPKKEAGRATRESRAAYEKKRRLSRLSIGVGANLEGL